mgnify:CR=1 FL=1
MKRNNHLSDQELDMLLNFPSKMASRVIGKKEIKEIEMILSEEIRFILGNLTK